ncbi:MAG: type II toxin-antitoxin system PemK/MazF family toxin [Lachnospiraceae bacterium]|nr:type II toxin-antitoxin system PemK/MazF family toxin [Lachnospiraceae bacterium]
MEKINRGEIWQADFGEPESEDDHKLHGIRPVVIVSNDKANVYSMVIHAVPLTSRIHKKSFLPTHIFLDRDVAKGLRAHSIAQCEQLCLISQYDLVERIGQVTEEQLEQIGAGMQVQLGMAAKQRRCGHGAR